MFRRSRAASTALIVGLALTGTATAELCEGERIPYERLKRIEPHLPAEVWGHRETFFYEGMTLRIGPAFRDYSPPRAYESPGEPAPPAYQYHVQASDPTGPVGAPFPGARCDGSPEAALRVARNFDRRWLGAASSAHFRAARIPPPVAEDGTPESSLDTGEVRVVAGYWTRQRLAHRVEAEYRSRRGDVFRGDKRHWVDVVQIEAPWDLRGLNAITHRYKLNLLRGKFDDTWLYVPRLRRIERITVRHRMDGLLGSDLTVEDLFGFNGRVGDFAWSCLEERTLLAPINSAARAYPSADVRDFGPTGASLASDRWELRHAVGLRLAPTGADHPYAYKNLWLDEATLAPLYAAAFDREEKLWRIFAIAHRWSEDAADLAASWPGVEAPRSLRAAVSVVWSVRDERGVRVEHWDNHARPPESAAKLRRLIDIDRGTKYCR